MSLYERVAALPSGGRALAVARLRRAVLAILHRAFLVSGLESQAALAKRLRVRRSAVNQVFRGDGNVRISTLAEYLYEMGFEISIALVKAGELRAAALDDRSPVPAFASASTSTSITFSPGDRRNSSWGWSGHMLALQVPAALASNSTPFVISLVVSYEVLGGCAPSRPVFDSINMSDDLAKAGAAS